jgi:hypothetical protein
MNAGGTAVKSQNVQHWSQTMTEKSETNPTDAQDREESIDNGTINGGYGDANEIMGRISNQFSRADRGIFVRLKYQKGVWPIAVKETFVARILLTLLNYSGQAMTSGGDLFAETVNLTIDGGCVESFCLRPGRYVKFSLTHLDAARAVFMPLSRPHANHDDEERGTDLNGACSIVRRHGGIITLDRRGNIGTTFNLYLPAAECAVGRNMKSCSNAVMGASLPEHP